MDEFGPTLHYRVFYGEYSHKHFVLKTIMGIISVTVMEIIPIEVRECLSMKLTENGSIREKTMF